MDRGEGTTAKSSRRIPGRAPRTTARSQRTDAARRPLARESRRSVTAHPRCPLWPDEPTSATRLMMTAKCQQRKSSNHHVRHQGCGGDLLKKYDNKTCSPSLKAQTYETGVSG